MRVSGFSWQQTINVAQASVMGRRMSEPDSTPRAGVSRMTSVDSLLGGGGSAALQRTGGVSGLRVRTDSRRASELLPGTWHVGNSCQHFGRNICTSAKWHLSSCCSAGLLFLLESVCLQLSTAQTAGLQ